jgi:flagellar motor component MotA
METEIVQKLKSFGVNTQNAKELYGVISQEVLNILFEDLAEKSTDEELRSIESRIQNAKSVEHFESIIKEIATTVYEDNAQQEIKNIYLDLVDSVEDTIKQANELLQKAQDGDPAAQKLLRKAQESETYKNIMNDQS